MGELKLTASWQEELSQSLTSVQDLERAGLLTATEALRLSSLGHRFQIRISPYYAGLMQPKSDCPIRQQAIPALGEEDPVLPSWAEGLSQEIYQRPSPWHDDAIGDLQNLAAPRLTHRYENRAILHLSSMCAVYCRFCFRKSHLNDRERTLYEGSLEPALEYLRRTPEVRELILTGGDPLAVTDVALARLLDRLGEVSHLKTVRIHSRMAVTLPSRLTPELATTLGQARNFQTVLVSHFNHPRELSSLAREGLSRVAGAGVRLYNQNVLLRGINDSLDTLEALYQGLYEAGVVPFYLHHPDWTPGTFHFRTSIERGRELMRGLRGRLPGPALPDYVLDIPQGGGKVSLLDGELRELQRHTEDGLEARIYEGLRPHVREEVRDQAPENRFRYLELFRTL